MTTEGTAAQPGSTGLLLTQDLIFSAKIVGTGSLLGLAIETASSIEQAQRLISAGSYRLVLVDLTSTHLGDPETIRRLRELAPDVPFVAFGPHVETARLKGAAEAGCAESLPRSRFVADLPGLLKRYLGSP